MLSPTADGQRYELNDPISLSKASGFLWNKQMMIHMNCRGYAVAQFMQPEPAKYAHAPNLEAKTFMQPEQPYYAHHPGRFCYLKDEETNSIFSAPYEPTRALVDKFIFSVGKSDLKWIVQKDGLQLEMTLTLPVDEPLELWEIKITNTSDRKRKVSAYPYFPVGYMSWMNQSGYYNESLNGVICSCVSPYQKYKDYQKIKNYKDKTFLLADTKPTSWEVNQEQFEGEGGLHHPTGIQKSQLEKGDARYETPAACMQYQLELQSGQEKTLRFLFGPARTEDDIIEIRERYFGDNSGRIFTEVRGKYASYVAESEGHINISTPDVGWDNFTNNWLLRQMFYHGETNRLSTDPQTRNYLQDNMGMGYIKPGVARQTFITALSQQEVGGAMPDGIIIVPGAELKYINQVPHTDHCVWVPICMQAYLDESDDYSLLEEEVPYADGSIGTVSEHLDRAMQFLLDNRDARGLSYIEQGDWCDPMNGVGPKGIGVSGWLTIASAYAINVWADITEASGNKDHALQLRASAASVNAAANEHFWDGNWYARGITDDNVKFGIKSDPEGSIFLNPQGWALLSGAADDAQSDTIVDAVTERLVTPYGAEMFGPPFNQMREDVGRVTQKYPGSAENGANYNHATAFYIYGLYKRGYADKAWSLLRKMIPSEDLQEIRQRGQLPVFIPNYYRGGYRQSPRTAGRSSQLFNTGTVSWVYRCMIDGLFGLTGTRAGLKIAPNLPSDWDTAKATRQFRGATFHVSYIRKSGQEGNRITVDGELLEGNVVTNIISRKYEVVVELGA